MQPNPRAPYPEPKNFEKWLEVTARTASITATHTEISNPQAHPTEITSVQRTQKYALLYS